MDYQKIGLVRCERGRCFDGFTLIGTFRGEVVRLVDIEGREVHRWKLPGRLGSLAYLLAGGRLFCSVQLPTDIPLQTARGGRILEMSWQGEILWEYSDPTQHHDFRRLPNGNTVYIGWRPLPDSFASRIPGGVPGTEAEGKIYEDYFREVNSKGEIVWEWATSALNPEEFPISDGVERMEFLHANTVCPLPTGNLLVSFRSADLIAVLDRERGGFCWAQRDASWGRQHDPQPIADCSRYLLFANGAGDKPKPQRSSVIEIDAKTGEQLYRWEAGIPWTFYSHVMGGVQRLPNGNTLVCESVYGRIFEIEAVTGEIVWDYINPDFSAPFPKARELANSVFRAYRYGKDSEELRGVTV